MTLPSLDAFTSSDEVDLPNSFMADNLDSASTSTVDSEVDDVFTGPFSQTTPVTLDSKTTGAIASFAPPSLKRHNAYMFVSTNNHSCYIL